MSLFHHCVSLPNFFLFVIVISCRLIVLICLFCSRRHSLIWSHLVSTLHCWWLFWLSLVPLLVWTYVVNLISYWIQDIVVQHNGLISSRLVLRLFFFKVLRQSSSPWLLACSILIIILLLSPLINRGRLFWIQVWVKNQWPWWVSRNRLIKLFLKSSIGLFLRTDKKSLRIITPLVRIYNHIKCSLFKNFCFSGSLFILCWLIKVGCIVSLAWWLISFWQCS